MPLVGDIQFAFSVSGRSGAPESEPDEVCDGKSRHGAEWRARSPTDRAVPMPSQPMMQIE